MSGDNIQILELAKQGLTPAEIATSLRYDIEAVEFVLNNDKEIIKELEKSNEGNRLEKVENGLDKLGQTALGVIKEILEDPYEKGSVRATLAVFVTEHQLGLKKPKVINNTVNIFDFNERMEKVKARKALLDQKIIEIEAVKV